jgi:type II secretion system protein N
VNRVLEILSLRDRPRLQNAAKWTGYVLFFGLVLLFALPWTFPSRQLRNFAIKQAAAQGYVLDIGHIGLRGLGGVEIEGLQLTLPGKDQELKEGGAMDLALPEATLQIERLQAKIALFPLLGRTVDVVFEMDAGGGTVEGGRIVRKGEALDVEVAKIAGVSLSEMGLGTRLLGSTRQVGGDLEGDLSGAVKIHYGGSTDDLTGAVDLDMQDAILRAPEVAFQGGIKLTDLALGQVTIKVKMNLKQHVAVLASQGGQDKATVIHVEKLEALGDNLELVTEETSHVLIPPGKQGFKAARIQLHFAFAVHDKPTAQKKGDDKGDEGDKADKGAKEEAKAPNDRANLAVALGMFKNKIAPFERNGFIGVTCTGPLLRPQCKLDVPHVTAGTRGHAAEGGGGGAPPPLPVADQAKPPEGEKPAEGEAAPPAPSPEPPNENVEFKPAVREDTPAQPAPPPPAAEPAPAEAQPPPTEAHPSQEGRRPEPSQGQEGDRGGEGRPRDRFENAQPSPSEHPVDPNAPEGTPQNPQRPEKERPHKDEGDGEGVPEEEPE